MKQPTEDFIIYLLDLLGPLGPVQARRMFGGHGIFFNGLMLGIVVDEVLYLKADDQNRKKFEEQELPRFTYQKQGKEARLSFYQAPPDAMEDSELMCEWARRSHEAALRAKK